MSNSPVAPDEKDDVMLYSSDGNCPIHERMELDEGYCAACDRSYEIHLTPAMEKEIEDSQPGTTYRIITFPFLILRGVLLVIYKVFTPIFYAIAMFQGDTGASRDRNRHKREKR